MMKGARVTKGIVRDIILVMVVASLYVLLHLLNDSHNIGWVIYPAVIGVLLFIIVLFAAVSSRRGEASAHDIRVLSPRLPYSIWITDARLRITQVIGARPPVLTGEVCIGTSLHDLLGGETSKPALTGHQRALQGKLTQYELFVDDRYYEIHIEPLRDKRGRVTGCVGLATDVTRRKQLEAQSQRHAEQLKNLLGERTAQINRVAHRVEAILNSTSDAIALLRPDGTVEQTNPAFDALLGYQMDEAFGQPLAFFVEPYFFAEVLSNALDTVAIKQQMQRVEIVARRKDGSTFDADVALAPVDIDGEPPAVVVSLRDITHLKEIDRFKTRFVDNAAHDLGNPIANLKLRLYLLKKTPERLPQYIEVLEHQVQRLEALVKDLRMLARMDRGATPLELAPVDLNALAYEVVSAHLSMAATKSQSLRLVAADDLPPVQADRFQLERVLVNLVANALHYTPEGGHVTVKTRCEGDVCCCTVTDDGMGIAPEDLPYIFERFYRSEAVKSAGLEGTGLGLAIAQDIIKAHSGWIKVESEPNKGSTFSFAVPRAGPDRAPAAGA
ncbi:MAG: PAS domain S-box protein [Anaerolineae bacterium]|nr:PAS domain S-box protein [Anaerolineae bacterium]